VALEADLVLPAGERDALGNPDLLAHQVHPVIISVTGCSTWSRVFISMK
jgi:hypothetical protein